MAVYTRLDDAEVAVFLAGFGLSPLLGLAPIAAGIENTNYRVEAGEPPRSYVLTVFERGTAAEVAETLALTSALASRGVPCPTPLTLVGSGDVVGTLRGKPAALVPFATGITVAEPAQAHLEALGHALAAVHRAGADLPFGRGGAHLAEVLCPLARGLADLLRGSEPALSRLLAVEADDQEALPEADLPGGVVHADLFLDNVLFDGGSPPGVAALLDFHLAGRGPWLFDLAVVLADAGWARGGVSGERARAFLGSYRAVRPLEPAEFAALPGYLRRAVLRFLCLRIQRCWLGEPRAVAGEGKDPRELAAHLEMLRQGAHGHG